MIKIKRKRGRPSNALIAYEQALQRLMVDHSAMIEEKMAEMLIYGQCQISESDCLTNNSQ